MRALLACLLLLLAGCAGPAATNEPADPTPRPPTTSEPPAGGGTWAEAEAATIRPGVQVVSDTGQCTSNFLFVDPTNVYVGIAAHCVEGLVIGAPLDIAHGAATGTLAYSSWLTMDDVDEQDADAREYNDFALVLLPPEARGLTSPSMQHFGGPTDLAASSAVAPRDKVLTYGNSGLRGEVDPASWKEGYVLETSAWSTTIYTATPGIPGDSGSGVLTGDGRALGILVTLTIAPTAGSNGVTHLDMALAYARENAGIDVQLAIAELEDAGLLPDGA